MRRRSIYLLVALLAIAACDIDFIDVVDRRYGSVHVESLQESSLQASVDVTLPADDGSPHVTLDGVTLAREAEGEFWSFVGSVGADSLAPSVEISIGRADPVVLTLPMLARQGPAVRRPDGSLELRITTGDGPADSYLSWQVSFMDAQGSRLVTLHSDRAPLPRPLVIGAGAVPAEAVTAEVRAQLYQEISSLPYPLTAVVSSRVHIPIAGHD